MEDSNQRPILSLSALAALRQLIQVLQSPKSDQQEQQILQILQTHPSLLPAFIRHRQQQDQSGGAEAEANMQGPTGTLLEWFRSQGPASDRH